MILGYGRLLVIALRVRPVEPLLHAFRDHRPQHLFRDVSRAESTCRHKSYKPTYMIVT